MTNIISKPLREEVPTIARAMGQCYYNAHYNRKYVAGMRHLKPVFGSLGLAGHFEYGGRNYSSADFYAKPLDSHCWLEDDDGNVYDYIMTEYVEMARMWGMNPTFSADRVVWGISKEDLGEEGLEYIPTTKKIGKHMLRYAISWLKKHNSHARVYDLSVFD